jgi:hypothetical protein
MTYSFGFFVVSDDEFTYAINNVVFVDSDDNSILYFNVLHQQPNGQLQ